MAKRIAIAVKTYQFATTLPKVEQFGLISQITRAGVSIPSNVAKGNSSQSAKDKARFVEISLGLSFELETQLLIAKAASRGSAVLCDGLLDALTEEQKMLHGCLKSLNG